MLPTKTKLLAFLGTIAFHAALVQAGAVDETNMCKRISPEDRDRLKPGSKPSNVRKMHRLDGNRGISTADVNNGVMIKALAKDQSEVYAGNVDVKNKNMFQICFDKAELNCSSWFWLDKSGWCWVEYDYLNIDHAVVYNLDQWG